MGVVNFDEYLRSAIQAGSAIEGTAAKVIADNGDEIGDVVYKVIEGGNGTAAKVGIATQTGVGGLVATGLAYLTMSLPAGAAAVAACLGINTGFALYNLAPEFWTNLSNQLVEAGKTVGGKILVYWNGENSYFDSDTIEIIKNAFVDYGAFESHIEIPEEIDISPIESPITLSDFNALYDIGSQIEQYGIKRFSGKMASFVWQYNNVTYIESVFASTTENALVARWGSGSQYVIDIYAGENYTFDDRTIYYAGNVTGRTTSALDYIAGPYNEISYEGVHLESELVKKIAWVLEYGIAHDSDIPLQDGATYPDENPFPLTYPDWYPMIYDPALPDPSSLPDIYPVKYPGVDPDPYPNQDPAQNPDPESVPEIYPVIIPDFPIPDPGIHEDPEPEPDPDPEPEPDPIPEDEPVNPDPDPVDPNGEPDPSVPIVVPSLPSTVSSNKLFTVYNPSSSQLDALGGYLWDSSIIAAIRDIWQEPMDGLISLQQVFVTPSTSGSHNIILGFLDSGVSAPVVSDQFVTVDCGSVQVSEDKNNATDYAPYTSLHLYLPFIGIVELDTNECMNSTISIKYKVDVYTGTCLAQISIDRDIDMPNDPILYTFSGNCSQQLPLTSGNATGLLSALIGAVTAGVSAASGGGLSTLAGAHLLGNSLTHEMMHVNHSGNISANAGIMGQKKPYLIIGRRHGYDANDYNSFYGFPANKTVNLGNHDGFIRIKKCWIKTTALQEEYEEIMRLLEEGVYL